MKKILISLVFTSALGLGSYTYAQPSNDTDINSNIPATGAPAQEHSKHKHKAKHFRRMTKALDLSYDQIEAIKALHKDAKANRPERERGVHIQQLNPNAADYYETVAAIAARHATRAEKNIMKRAELHASVFAILTPEQQEKALVLSAERKERNK